MELVVRLWDVYLAVNDPALVFFLLAALLVRNRQVKQNLKSESSKLKAQNLKT